MSRDEIILDLGWAINPMTGGLVMERKGRFGQRERQTGQCKDEADIEVMLP